MALPAGSLLSRADFAARVGHELGVSDWFTITQDRIDAFADCTEDWQDIHVDPVAAAAGPFGTPIAHGFLTLSLLSAMVYQVPGIEGVKTGVNTGFDRVRFVSPVRVGAQVRGRFILARCHAPRPDELQITLDVTVEIAGQDKPALVAVWLGRRYF